MQFSPLRARLYPFQYCDKRRNSWFADAICAQRVQVQHKAAHRRAAAKPARIAVSSIASHVRTEWRRLITASLLSAIIEIATPPQGSNPVPRRQSAGSYS